MHDVTFVVFGGTGDLTKRKLAPAFAALLKDGVLTKGSTIIGVGRSDYNDKSYKELLVKSAGASLKDYIKKLDVRYYQGDASVESSLKGLKDLIDESGKKNCERIFYLATSFTLFDDIIKEIHKYKLDKGGCSAKIVFEKPFGHDLKSNNLFEAEMKKYFSQDQIYRIDHYLGKETITNLNSLKFENPMIDAVMNKDHVTKIEVIVDEDLKMGKRIAYYNEFGAIKDMIQSHLLQVIALLLMDKPKTWDSKDFHAEKAKVLACLQVEEPKKHLLGQYKGYASELKEYELDQKKTETFAKISLNCKNPRWNGVDITLRTGKALKSKFGKIVVHFQRANCAPNKLEVNIQPKQDIDLFLNFGKPGVCQQVKLNFCHDCLYGANTMGGYEKMIADIIDGHHTWFTTAAENVEAWKIVERIEKIRDKIPFKFYADGKDPEK